MLFSIAAANYQFTVCPLSQHAFSQEREVCRKEGGGRPVFGLKFSPLRRTEVVEELLKPVARGMGVRLFATANLDHVVNLRRSEDFRRAYGMSWLVTADGMPVYLYARLVGVALPQRVTGADVIAEILRRWSPSAHRLFFLLSGEEAARRLKHLLRHRGFEDGQVRIVVAPPAFEREERFGAALVAQIRTHRPTHLVLGIGAPKSEIWTLRHGERLGDLYVLAIGASIEFATRLKRRAPNWMSRMGLEWLWRFVSEPKRLFSRYFIRSWGIVPAVLADLKSGGRTVRPAGRQIR